MEADTVSSLLTEAATLMLVGMVFVFTFLTLLIGGIEGIARFCRRFPGEQEEPPEPAPVASAKNSDEHDPRVLAAISAAIHTHRQSRPRRLTKE